MVFIVINRSHPPLKVATINILNLKINVKD